MASSVIRVQGALLQGGGVWFFLLLALTGSMARAQALTVLPVNVQFPSGQKATTLTVINRGDVPTSIQIRVFAWGQADGIDQLTTSDAILVSPPLATIVPGASQIIRLVLRSTPERREDTYRILLDQIPPPAEPGIVHVVLRMSIPIFVQPKLRATSRVQFHVERGATQTYLVALNDSPLHESLHGMDLWTEDNLKLKTDFPGSQYILAGATRRWLIAAQDPTLLLHDTIRLTAIGLNGSIKQQVHIVDLP